MSLRRSTRPLSTKTLSLIRTSGELTSGLTSVILVFKIHIHIRSFEGEELVS